MGPVSGPGENWTGGALEPGAGAGTAADGAGFAKNDSAAGAGAGWAGAIQPSLPPC